MEKEAYERARAFDTATINRQTGMIEELNEENDILRDTIRELRSRVNADEDG